jgi:hypothetical protein
MTHEFNQQLANDYGILRRYVGEVRFNAMAVACASAGDVRSRRKALPDMLAAVHTPFPELVELALLERALRQAEDAPDAAILTRLQFEQIHLQDHNISPISFHPSMQLLTFTQNTVGIWSSLQCGEIPPRPYRLEQPQKLMVWRQRDTARMRHLGEEEYRAVAIIQDTGNLNALHGLLEIDATVQDVEQSALGYILGWLDSDILLSSATANST